MKFAIRMSVKLYELQHKKRFETIIKMVDGNDVLDYGCHTGYISIALKKLGRIVTAVDVKSELIAHHSRLQGYGINSYVSVCPLPFCDNSFDCVVMGEVLEHLPGNPIPILKDIVRVLKGGGVLILTTPNVMRIENKLRFLLGINIYQELCSYLTHSASRHHHREYTKGEVIDLLTNYVGLSIKKVKMKTFITARTPLRRLIQRLLAPLGYFFRGTIIVEAHK